MPSQISLKLHGECAKWTENFSKTDASHRRFRTSHYPLITSPSCRFVFFALKKSFVAVDLSRGLEKSYEFCGNEENDAEFFPLNDEEFLAFKLERSKRQDNPNFLTLSTAKFQLDHKNMQIKMVDLEWKKLMQISSLEEISVLEKGKSVYIQGEKVVDRGSIPPQGTFYYQMGRQLFISEFDLISQKIISTTNFYDTGHQITQRPTFSAFCHKFEENFYFFHGFDLPGLWDLHRMFSKITKVESNGQVVKLLDLKGFEDCCEKCEVPDPTKPFVVNENWEQQYLYTSSNGIWSPESPLFFLHLQFYQLCNPSQYRHHFCVLNLIDLQWTQINIDSTNINSININSIHLDSMPLKWSWSERENTLLLVGSINGHVSCENGRLEEKRGSGEGRAWRLALGTPDSLLQLSLASTNRNFSKWSRKNESNSF